MGGRLRPRSRCGGATRQERQRRRHLSGSGGGGPDGGVDRGLPWSPRGSVHLRRACHREPRGRFLHARAVDDDRRLRRGARGWSARDGRPFVRAARPRWDARRSRAAGGARRTKERAGARIARIGRAAEYACGDGGRRDAPDHATGNIRRRDEEAVGGVTGAGRDRAARQRASRRVRAGGRKGARRRRLSGGGCPALWPRPVDGVCRRGVVALADDGGVHRSEP